MDITSQLIIGSVVILALVLIFTIGFLETIPVFARINFDSICNKFLDILSTQGELSIDEINELKIELTKTGFTNIDVTVPESKQEWGEDAMLVVEACYPYEVLQEGKKAIVNKKITYENATKIFGLEN